MKKALITIVLLLGNLFVFAQAKFPESKSREAHIFSEGYPDSARLLKRYRYNAKEAFKTNNFDLALDYAYLADSMNPNQVDMKYIEGVSYLQSTTRIDALNPLIYAKKNNYKPEEIDFYLAQAYHLNNYFDSAIYYYKQHLIRLDTSSKKNPEQLKMHKFITKRIDECLTAKEMMKDSLHVEIKNIGPKVNSRYSDYVPMVNADETIMYFTSRRPNTTDGIVDVDNRYYEDIYVSNFENGQWGEPKNLAAPVNHRYHDACIGTTPDGQKLFMHRSKTARAVEGHMFITEKEGDKWKNPKPLGSDINSTGWESSACLTPDGKRLYFSSDRPGGYGEHDIYYVDITSAGQWGKAVNLGPDINTAGDEESPYLHFDGKTLFFSSNGHRSIGGFDVFSSTWRDDTKTWTKPENLGYPINTADDDMYFVYSADGSKGYFSGHRKDSYGEKDIYIVTRPNSDPNMMVLVGRVLDRETMKPLPATITITNLKTKKVIGTYKTNNIGKFVLALNFGVNHSVEIESPGYVFETENINIANSGFKFQHKQDFLMDRPKAKTSIALNNIFFESNSADLRPESVVELEKLHQILVKNPNWLVELGGHTDSIGNSDYNIELSKARALAVVDYEVAKGIDHKKMIAVGYGETMPVADNGTPEGRQQNRRTVLTIKEILSGISNYEGTAVAHHPHMTVSDMVENPNDKEKKLKSSVYFLYNNGKDITPHGLKLLDRIATLLKENPKYKLKLLPSVELIGNEYNNKTLYDLRAKTATDYLVGKGLETDRIITKEFKPTKLPKEKDFEKRTIKNRRIEFLLVE
jgi:outer membrane protein OmpA-like peptidoglycan-associated protein